MKKVLKKLAIISMVLSVSALSFITGYAKDLPSIQGYYGTTHEGAYDVDGTYMPIPALTLHWTSVSGAEKYEVWCRDKSDDTWSEWYINQVVQSTFAEEWIIDGYLQVKIRAVSQNDNSNFTETITFLGGVGITEGSTTAAAAVPSGWQQDNNGWWYKRSNGSYPTSQWEQINGHWYHFNESGYMHTGWFQDNDGKYYYLNNSGEMMINYTTPDGYTLDSNGVWVSGLSNNTSNSNTMLYKQVLTDALKDINYKNRDNIFSLLDINNDGIKELIVDSSNTASDSVSFVYTIINNKVEQCYFDNNGTKDKYLNSVAGYIPLQKVIVTYSNWSSQEYNKMILLNGSKLSTIDSISYRYNVEMDNIDYYHLLNKISEDDYNKRSKMYFEAQPIDYKSLTESNINNFVY